MHRIVSFVVLVAILLLLGALFFRVIAAFLVPLFLALVLVVLFRPLYLWMVRKCKNRPRIAAVLTTVAVLLSVLIPFSIVLTVAGVELGGMIGDMRSEQRREQFNEQVKALRERFGLTLPEPVAELDEQMATLLDLTVVADWDVLAERILAMRNQLDELQERIQARKQAEPSMDTAAAERTLSALRRDLKDLATLAAEQPRSEAWQNAFEATQRNYYTLRGRLVPVFYPSEEPPGRFKTWRILHANPTPRQVDEIRTQLLELLGLDLAVTTGTAVGRALLGLVFGLIVMTIALYYFLVDGPQMVDSVMHVSPLDRRHVAQLLGEFDKVSRAVVLATLLSAFAQGILGGIGYWLAGFESVFLLTVLTMVLAMIPFVGAAAVWIPCCLWLLLAENRMLPAIVLAVYGAVVVSAIDNVIKPYVLHGQSNLHPLLALLSVLGGVQALGPIGIFVGPMAVAFLQALLHMLQGEMRDIEKPPNARPELITPEGIS
jgi:predicted PurR-regulated permease PerM